MAVQSPATKRLSKGDACGGRQRSTPGTALKSCGMLGHDARPYKACLPSVRKKPPQLRDDPCLYLLVAEAAKLAGGADDDLNVKLVIPIVPAIEYPLSHPIDQDHMGHIEHRSIKPAMDAGDGRGFQVIQIREVRVPLEHRLG